MHANELKEPPVSEVSSLRHKAKKGEYWGKEGAIALAERSLRLGPWIDGNAYDLYLMSSLFCSAARNAWARWKASHWLDFRYFFRYRKAKRRAREFSDRWEQKVTNDVAISMELCVRADSLSLSGEKTKAYGILCKVLDRFCLGDNMRALLNVVLAEILSEIGDDNALSVFKRAHGFVINPKSLGIREEVRVRVFNSYAYFLSKPGGDEEDKKMASSLAHQAVQIATRNGLVGEMWNIKLTFRRLGLPFEYL